MGKGFPVGGHGGPYRLYTKTHIENILSQTNFVLKFESLLMYSENKQTNKQTNKKQNKTKQMQQKIENWMAAKKQLKFRDINLSTKNRKTIFPKKFSHKIWLINRECAIIFLKLNLKKKAICLRFKGQNILNSSLGLLFLLLIRLSA